MPVIHSGRLVGIISDRDIRKHSQEAETIRIGSIMSENPICVSPDDTVTKPCECSCRARWRASGHQETELVGIITTTDILKVVLGFPAFDK